MTAKEMSHIADYYLFLSIAAHYYMDAIEYQDDLEISLLNLLLWKENSYEAWDYLHQIIPSKRIRAMLIAGGATL